MKIAIPWVLVVALLAGTYWLYSSGRGKDADIARLTQENQELTPLRTEVEQLHKVASQSDELERLRKDNEGLLKLRSDVTQLREQNRQMSNQLQSAQAQHGQAVQQQQQLSQLAAENQQLRSQSQQVQQAQAKAQADACINNLRQIDSAKQQWAFQNQKPANAMPTFADIAPYFPNGTPTCPAGGTYAINLLTMPPTCNVPGHAIPRQ